MGDPGALQNTETFPHISVPFSTEEPFISHTPDVYIPFFTLIEFISYMGWIKVAETLLNPFGDDDEDFDINYLIDRNLQVSYLIVDLADADMELANDPWRPGSPSLRSFPTRTCQAEPAPCGASSGSRASPWSTSRTPSLQLKPGWEHRDLRGRKSAGNCLGKQSTMAPPLWGDVWMI